MGMAETKTEQAKQKASEVADAVKVKEGVKKAEKSAVGKHIPTSLDALTFRDIIKITLVLNSIMTLGLYCIVSAALTDMQPGLRATLLNIVDWMIVLFGVMGVITDALFFFAHLFSLFKIFLLIKVLKIAGMILFIPIVHKESWLMTIVTTSYTLSCVFLDLCYVYYLAIYEERVESDDYDADGMLKKNRKHDEL